MEEKFSKTCRTCMVEENNLHFMFQKEAELHNLQLNFLVSTITGLQISKSDGLPTSICSSCKNCVTLAYEFREKSEKADAALREMILKVEADKLDTKADINNKIKTEIVPAATFEQLKEHTSVEVKCEFGPDFVNDFDTHDMDLMDEINDTEEFEIDILKCEPTSKETSKDFKCRLCNTSFTSATLLKIHITSCVKVELDDDKISFCPICGHGFHDSQKFLKHLLKHCSNEADGSEITIKKKKAKPKKVLADIARDNLRKKQAKEAIKKNKEKIQDTEYAFEVKLEVGEVKCAFCELIFQSKDVHDEHMTKHEGVNLFSCIHCECSYITEDHVKTHTAEHHPKETKIATKDQAIVKTEQEAETKDSVKEVLLSSNNNQNTLTDYLRTNSNYVASSLRVCRSCGLLLPDQDLLTNHVDNEHPDLSLKCNFCKKYFGSIKTAQRHRRVCEKMESKYECPTCGVKYAYEMSLNKHILREHEGQSVSVKFINPKYKAAERKFPCTHCARRFYRQDLLDKHLAIHLPSEKKFECDVCKKKFSRKDNLKSHTKIHDPNRVKPTGSLCLYCGRSFSNSSNMIVHMRRHTGEKPYKCDFCGKGFPRSSDLQCHRRSHTGEKPCLCTICGKGFSRTNKLQRHMRIHTGQRPYKCTYCGKAFAQSNDLTLHVRRHTGDKPYVCEVCGDRFIQGTALHNHRRVHGHYLAATPDGQAPTQQPKLLRNLLTVRSVGKKAIVETTK